MKNFLRIIAGIILSLTGIVTIITLAIGVGVTVYQGAFIHNEFANSSLVMAEHCKGKFAIIFLLLTIVYLSVSLYLLVKHSLKNKQNEKTYSINTHVYHWSSYNS